MIQNHIPKQLPGLLSLFHQMLYEIDREDDSLKFRRRLNEMRLADILPKNFQEKISKNKFANDNLKGLPSILIKLPSLS